MAVYLSYCKEEFEQYKKNKLLSKKEQKKLIITLLVDCAENIFLHYDTEDDDIEEIWEEVGTLLM